MQPKKGLNKWYFYLFWTNLLAISGVKPAGKDFFSTQKRFISLLAYQFIMLIINSLLNFMTHINEASKNI
jgi:hypothetical protein